MENINSSPVESATNYYNTWTKKFIDFGIGFIGCLILGYLTYRFDGALALVILFFVFLFGMPFFFKISRNFIIKGIGLAMLTSSLTFLLLYLFIWSQMS